MSARILASVFAHGPDDAVLRARRAAMEGADWIELRLDRWAAEPGDLRFALAGIDLPVLVACRTPKDGGEYGGEARERVRLLETALEHGAQGVDVEGWEPWSPDRSEVRLLVRSYHGLHGVPADLSAIRDRLLDRGAHVAKLVCRISDLADAAPLLDLMGASDPEQEPTVAFAMGRASWPTRVLAVLLGASWCYARSAFTAETAPGQPTVGSLASLYGVRRFGTATALFGLLGDPAMHSWGPWLHNRVFRDLGIDAVYLPFETSRPRDVMRMLPRRRLRGLSVTAPHKETMAALCHELDEAADAAGVVNTLTFGPHGRVVGANTDVPAIERALTTAGLPQRPTPRDDDADAAWGVVIGGGGAARAAAVALERLGLRVLVLARTLEPMRAFARARGYELAVLGREILDARRPVAVVHATPLGGSGRSGEARVVPDWQPAPGTVVLDLVYPADGGATPLLDDAAAAGAVPVRGIEMFLGQAHAQLRAFLPGENVPDLEQLRGFVGMHPSAVARPDPGGGRRRRGGRAEGT
jgi:3-dehydroquinate dehydratase/shikimate dehydrogenase